MTISDPVVRRARGGDVGDLAQLMGELGHPISLSDMRNRVELVSANPDHELLVAEADGQVVGLIGIQIVDVIHRVGRVGVITALVVLSDYRRCGIASRLLEHAEALLRGKAIKSVRVSAALHRAEEAHRFYRARGFELTGYRFAKRLGRHDGSQ